MQKHKYCNNEQVGNLQILIYIIIITVVLLNAQFFILQNLFKQMPKTDDLNPGLVPLVGGA